jgi:hypothetical protein
MIALQALFLGLGLFGVFFKFRRYCCLLSVSATKSGGEAVAVASHKPLGREK